MELKSGAFDLESLFELSPDLLCIAGYDGYFKKVNSSVQKTLGYSYDELFSNPINHFVHPADTKKTTEMRHKQIGRAHV